MFSTRIITLLALGQILVRPVLAAHKEFDFTVTWKDHAPDGFTRKMLLVNGKSPGPGIVVDQDDTVVVRVCNESPFNTTIHFHGIEMYRTPWSDGVPGVSQRSIEPGETFSYEWTATQYGSYWYHSHFKGHIEDGLYGPVTIHPRDGDPKPFSMISDDPAAIKAMEKAEAKVSPLMISDFTHLTSNEKWKLTAEAHIEDWCYDSIVFNGKGHVECHPAQELAKYITPAKAQYLSLVPGATLTDKGCLPLDVARNATGGGRPGVYPPGVWSGCKATKGSLEVLNTVKSSSCGGGYIAIDVYGSLNFNTGVFSIDEHDMWVYAMDGSYIKPQKVQAIVVTNGDRYSVMVHTTKAGDFKMRFASNAAPQFIEGHAMLHVAGEGGNHGSSSKPYIDLAGNPISPNVVFFNQTTAAPFPPDPVAEKADTLIKLTMQFVVPQPIGGQYLWALNSSLLPISVLERETPMLFDPMPFEQNNVTISTLNGTWVDLLLFATPGMPPHPIHKHGNKMFQIGSGAGNFTWSSVEEAMKEIPGQFNLVDPPRRDAFASAATPTGPSWIVLRYHVVNPGAWLLHCHIASHMVSGMMMVIQDGVDHFPNVPPKYLNF